MSLFIKKIEEKMEVGCVNEDKLSLKEKTILIFYKQAYDAPDSKHPLQLVRYDAKFRRYIEQDGKCCFCDRNTIANLQQPYNKLRLATIEHLTPRSMGGEDSYDNYRISCYECNQERGCLDFEVFLDKMKGVKRPVYE